MKMLKNALKGFGLGTIFKNILWENKKIINFIDCFLYFS